MKNKVIFVVCILLVLSFSLVSASWFGNFLNKITGKATQDCIDTDGGKDYYVRGTVNYEELKTDFCQVSSALTCGSPNEEFCVNCYKRGGMVKADESGCFCPSSGIYINAWYGTCSGSLDYVREFYCDGGTKKFESYKCPNGCVDGACVQQNQTNQTCDSEHWGWEINNLYCEVDNLNNVYELCAYRNMCYYDDNCYSTDTPTTGNVNYPSGSYKKYYCGTTCTFKDVRGNPASCSDSVVGIWYDGDYAMNPPNKLCELTGLGKLGTWATKCESNSMDTSDSNCENGFCCGDDLNEYYITTSGMSACCSSSGLTVDANGNCVFGKIPEIGAMGYIGIIVENQVYEEGEKIKLIS